MKINSLQFNFIQRKPQNTAGRVLYKNKELQADTFTFGRNYDTEDETALKMRALVPKHKGVIYEKVTDEDGNVIKKIPTEVEISNKTAINKFDFIHDGKNIGYVTLSYIPEKYCEEENEGIKCVERSLYKNYRDLGVVGDRIIVEYVENKNDYKYGGIGHLADLIEVAACKKLGFEPNVISESLQDAVPLHYKRGKRFVPYDRYMKKSLIDIYGLNGENPNDTVKKMVENTQEGEEFDVSEIKYAPLMYMPKEMIKELEEELKEHPIF